MGYKILNFGLAFMALALVVIVWSVPSMRRREGLLGLLVDTVFFGAVALAAIFELFSC